MPGFVFPALFPLTFSEHNLQTPCLLKFISTAQCSCPSLAHMIPENMHSGWEELLPPGFIDSILL